MNQNSIRAAINSVSNMTDREFFTCPSMAEFFNTFTAGVTKLLEADIKIHLMWDENSCIAYATNHNEITLNAENIFTKNCDRETRFTILKGLALHENGHLLFTDYRLLKERQEKLMNGTIYPSDENEVIKKAEKILQNAGAGLRKVAVSLLHEIDNIIEDGFIEYVLLGLCKGYSRNLTYLRKLQSEGMKNWDEQIESGIAETDVLTNCILGYAKYGLDLVPRDASDPAKAVYTEILDDIDRAIKRPDPMKRAAAVNAVFSRIFLYLYEKANQNPEQNGNGKGDENNNSSEGQNGQENRDSSSGDDEKGQQDRNADTDHDAENGDAQNASERSGNEPNMSKLEDMIKQIVKNGAEHLKDEGNHDQLDKSSAPGSFRKEQGILLRNMPDIKDRSQDVKKPSSGADLNAVIKAEKDRVASEEVEKSIKKELNQIKNNMNQPFSSTVTRAKLGSIEDYNSLKQEMLPISKRMQAELIREIDDKRNGQNMKRLYTGRYLDVSGLCQHDGKAFSRNIDPEDFPDMSVCILIDMSGSMTRDGKNYLAEKAAFVTHDFCCNLHIPVSIYGHQVIKNQIKLTSFAEFDSIDGKDAIRIASIRRNASGCNRDGYALRFCAEHLMRQNSDVKIFFVLSDGLPSAYSGMDDAIRDMHNVLDEYSKKGVIFIVAGIAADNKQLMVYYSTKRYHAHFLDITDLKRLPKQFVKILKKRLEKSL